MQPDLKDPCFMILYHALLYIPHVWRGSKNMARRRAGQTPGLDDMIIRKQLQSITATATKQWYCRVCVLCVC